MKYNENIKSVIEMYLVIIVDISNYIDGFKAS